MSRSSAPSRYLSVWFDRLAIDRTRRTVPSLGSPLALVGKQANALRVEALDPAGLALGLVPGMTLADARAQVPELQAADADPGADRRALKALARACRRYTPSLALDPPDGLMLNVTGAARLFGGDPERFVSPLQASEIRFGEIWFTWQDVLTLVGTLVLFGVLWLVLNRTRAGAIVRSVAEDPKLAQLFGINAAMVYVGVFVFECAAVALAAGLVAPRSPILTSMGFDEVILTFVVVVLGGIGSVTGSLVAGFGLGLFTALFGALVSSAYTTAAAFFVLLAFLVLRPRGLVAR
jgi:branched-subunit amino acid ABC-type transport system permease component